MAKSHALRKYLATKQIDASKLVHDEEEEFNNTIPQEKYADGAGDSEGHSIQKKKKRPKTPADW